jgi:paraquat-inducible protein A
VLARRWDAALAILASAILLGIGLFLPVLTIEKLVVFENTFSVASGIVALVKEGDWFLAAVIFIFSVVFPIAKLAVLWLIWWGEVGKRRRERLLGWLKSMGKWSMLDVFVVALTIVSVKLGALATAQPRVGIYVFGASVLLSMIATWRVEGMAAEKASHA